MYRQPRNQNNPLPHDNNHPRPQNGMTPRRTQRDFQHYAQDTQGRVPPQDHRGGLQEDFSEGVNERRKGGAHGEAKEDDQQGEEGCLVGVEEEEECCEEEFGVGNGCEHWIVLQGRCECGRMEVLRGKTPYNKTK